MKFSNDFLQGKAPEKPVTDIAYNQTKGNLEQPDTPDPEAWWQFEAKRHAQLGFIVLPTLKAVLIRRANGERVCTLREADISRRAGPESKILANTFLLAALTGDFGAFLGEDNWEAEHDIYALRIRWNRGVDWRKNRSKVAGVDEQRKGMQQLADLRQQFIACQLPLHKEEEEHGFPEELLRPEWGDRTKLLHRMAATK